MVRYVGRKGEWGRGGMCLAAGSVRVEQGGAAWLSRAWELCERRARRVWCGVSAEVEEVSAR